MEQVYHRRVECSDFELGFTWFEWYLNTVIRQPNPLQRRDTRS